MDRVTSPPDSSAVATLAPPPATAPADAVLFDDVTRERLRVAHVAADTLERLSESGSWDQLDAAIAAHVVAHARRLRSFVTEVRTSTAVRGCEPQKLAVRRLERRLEVTLEMLAPTEPSAGATRDDATPPPAGGLFHGDFTNTKQKAATAQPRQPAPTPRARMLARRLAKGRQRFVQLGVVGAVVIFASVLTRVLTGSTAAVVSTQAPPVAYEQQRYLDDMRVFVPATYTLLNGQEMTAIVSKDWLARKPEQRREDAAGARVFLANRNVTDVTLQWPDGKVIVAFTRDTETWGR